MTCLNFDHVQPYSKKWSKKIKLAPNEIFSQKTTNKIFVYIWAPFIVQSFIVDPELWGCTILGPKMVHLPQTNFFFWKRILIFFSSTYWPLSFCKIFKRFFQQIQSYDNVSFLGPICPNNFFRKPINKPCFFHSCLSTCQKSNSDINLLMKCWRLKNTEISRAIFA